MEDNLGQCIDPRSDFASTWAKICIDQRTQKAEFISLMRGNGFKAAHPNDGWVDRQNLTIHMCYPYFDDGIQVGDKIMIAFASDAPEKRRPVLVTGVSKKPFLLRYDFEDLPNS